MNDLKTKHDIIKNVDIIIDQINLFFSHTYNQSKSKNPHIVWLNEDFYCAKFIGFKYKLIITNPPLLNDELTSKFIFHKNTKIIFRNIFNNKIFDPLKENKVLYYKFFNGNFGYYTLVRKKDINHKLYINDELLLNNLIYCHMRHIDLFKEKIIFKDFYTYIDNDCIALRIESIHNFNALWNIDLIISENYISNIYYYQITECGYNKKMDLFNIIVRNLSNKLNSIFDHDIEFNIKMYNRCYDIKNYLIYTALDYLNDRRYFKYEK